MYVAAFLSSKTILLINVNSVNERQINMLSHSSGKNSSAGGWREGKIDPVFPTRY